MCSISNFHAVLQIADIGGGRVSMYHMKNIKK